MSDRRESHQHDGVQPVMLWRQQQRAHRIEMLLDRVPSLLSYWDRDVRNVIANAAYFKYFGVTPEQARGSHLRDIVGEDLYTLDAPHVEAVLGGVEQQFERTFIDVQGVTRHTQVAYLPEIVHGRVLGFYVQVIDVTARVQAEQSRDLARRLFDVSMANAPFGKAVLDTSGQTLQINPALCSLLGYSAEQIVGKDFRDMLHPEDHAAAEADLARLMSRTEPQVGGVYRYVRSDGNTVIWMHHVAVLVPGDDEYDELIVAQFQDVTARRDAEAELGRLARTDPLTGLHNRHAFTERIEAQRRADPAAQVGVVYVDLDGFKHVNDTYGHFTGDAVLVRAADLLTKILRPHQSAHRMGGDEFVILAPCASASQVARLASIIRKTLTTSYPTSSDALTLTASVGWTLGATHDVETLLRRADEEMYRQKRQRPQRY